MTVDPFEGRLERQCVESKCELRKRGCIMSMYTTLMEKCSGTEKVKYLQSKTISETYMNKEGSKDESR